MNHCYGSIKLFPSVFIDGACGNTDLHGEHDFSPSERICPGAPAGFEADCGHLGPHGPHPADEKPTYRN